MQTGDIRDAVPAEPSAADLAAATTHQRTQSPHETQCLLHELQVHQAELLQQNEELRRLRTEIEAGLARYTDLYDFAPVGYLTLSQGGNIVQLNIAAAVLLEQEQALATGKCLVSFIHEVERAEFTNLLAHTFATDERQSCVLMLAGDVARTVQIEAVRANDQQSCRVVMFDISARIHAEAQRVLLEAQLRESQKMEAIGTLAGGIAHDFNNILSTIIGNAVLASEGCGPTHPAHVSLDEIKKAGQRAKRLVEQILSFSRRRPRQFVEQSLPPVVSEALHLMRANLPTSIALTHTSPQTDVVANIDAAQIEQVLLNVITNAWEAISADSGNIAVELRVGVCEPRDCSTIEAGAFAQILISDTGRGMDQATLARIYEPFFTTKPLNTGTGLGLAVAHGVMQDHGGSIRVSTTSAAGTTFELRLPIVRSVPIAPPSPAPPRAEATGQHVLYLDDDEPMVYMVTRLLQKLGYRVSGFERTDEALSALRSDPHSFDLVVTDFNMPGPSGLDVAREVALIRPELPVVITSGYITDKLQEGARLVGVRHLAYKPNTVDELCQVIQRILLDDDGAASKTTVV